jgi:uncharacterized protein YkwD
MSRHQKKRHYRKMAIVAIAIAAVGTPSVAMASVNRQGDNRGNESHGRWNNTSHNHRWSRGTSSPEPGAPDSQWPTRAPSAPDSGTPTSGAPASGASSSAMAAVVDLVNSEAGCAPLTVNAELTKAAQDHSQDMADHQNMSHTGSDGSSPGDRITGAGYSWSTYGENVAYGYDTPSSVMAGWMSSPGHKRNILDCSYKEIGVGLAQPGNYWTQDFGAAR